jgi:predicted nucleic acid-binding protein
MRAFVDSSFIVALVNRNDAAYPKALEILQKYPNLRLYTDRLVYLESVNVALRKWGKPSAKKIIRWFTNFNLMVVKISPEIELNAVDLAIKNYSRSGPNVFDYLHFSSMKHYGLSDVLTFDSHFSRFGFNILK